MDMTFFPSSRATRAFGLAGLLLAVSLHAQSVLVKSYVQPGGGGAGLSPMGSKEKTNELHADLDTPTTVNAKSMFDRHAFTLVELDAQKLVLRQIDVHGTEVDQITITKPRR